MGKEDIETLGLTGVPSAELIERYYTTDFGNEVVMRELSCRLVTHFNLGIDPTTTPLIGRDRKQIVINGVGATLDRYIEWAEDDHPDHVGVILDTLLTEPETEEYDIHRQAIAGRLGIALS